MLVREVLVVTFLFYGDAQLVSIGHLYWYFLWSILVLTDSKLTLISFLIFVLVLVLLPEEHTGI